MKQLWMDWQTFAEAAEAGQETERQAVRRLPTPGSRRRSAP